MITVISLFDGMSCGQIALDQLGIKVDRYFASEVDKYAMKVTKHNYPNTIHIGDVTKVRIYKYRDFIVLRCAEGRRYKIYGKIYLIGGSPCQGFSFAGKMEGAVTEDKVEVTTLRQYMRLKRKGFKFKGQSYLFWEYIRIKNEINPDIFLLENVRMVKKWKEMFDLAVGVPHIFINSALVSAQSRPRLYWTNLKVEQPEDKEIVIADILEDDVDEKYYISKELLNFFITHTEKMKAKGNGFSFKPHEKPYNKKAYCITNPGKNRVDDNYIIAAQRGRYVVDGKRQDHKMKTAGLTTQRLEPRYDGKTNCLTNVQKDNYVIKYPRIRKLTPVECERLQTVPDNYTSIVSNSQRYRMLGNGWTVEVIKHLFVAQL